jgi:hypothetical protein
MTKRFILSFAFVTLAAGLLYPTMIAAQTAKPQPGAIARTADGHPDLQGLWLYFDSTPLETPGAPPRRRVGESRDNPGISDRLQSQAAQRRAQERGGEQDANPFYSEEAIRGKDVKKRASLVVDPPDGKIPVLPGPVAKLQDRTDHYSDSYKYLNPAERCITYGVPGAQFPSINSAVRILESPGKVALVYEMNGARIIPVDGSKHLPSNIHLWNGDSRGRWEGDTLVIDITNYNDEVQTTPNPTRTQGITTSFALHVVERYTPIDANTINYRVTIEDPNTYSRPWTAEFPLHRDNGSYKQFEYVCHEGNFRFMNIVLGGGRLKDKGANAEDAAASETRKAAEDAWKKSAK